VAGWITGCTTNGTQAAALLQLWLLRLLGWEVYRLGRLL
jgi:hypothetical protein